MIINEKFKFVRITSYLALFSYNVLIFIFIFLDCISFL